MGTELDDAALSTLRTRLSGHVTGPSDAGWDGARRAYNLTVDQQPAAVALPADEADVATAVRFAGEHGLRVAAQRTGHNAAPLAAGADTLVVNTASLDGVAIDAARRRARVGGGATWQAVVPTASAQGLAALHGSSPRLGVAGYTLGGGLSWYARQHGWAANSVTAVELVTADAEHARVDADTEPELFWAVRGGGGNFGVVTALELALYPMREVYAGALFFPWGQAGEVAHAWREWTASVPEATTSVARLLQLPPIPEVPEALRGRSFAVVEAVHTGGEAEGAELLAPLRALGPEMDTFAPVEPAGISDLHMDPPDPVPYHSDHRLLGELPAAAVDALIEAAGPGSGSPLLSVELRHLGGALARPEAHHGALAALDERVLCFAVGMTVDAPSTAAVDDHLTRTTAALAPHATATRCLNFTEHAADASTFFPAGTFEQLQAVKARYDPHERFRANHPIPPAG